MDTDDRHGIKLSQLLAGLAFFLFSIAALLSILGGVGSRFGWWHFRTGFTWS